MYNHRDPQPDYAVSNAADPLGLVGEDIPRAARILAVADAYSAMTMDRPYRKGLPASEAVSRLRAGAGQFWDPTYVDALCDVLDRKA